MSMSSILSRPLNIQGALLGSEMNILRIFQEGSVSKLQELLKLGLNPDSCFTHPKYKNCSLLSFVILHSDLSLEIRLTLVKILLEYKASSISLISVSHIISMLSFSDLELAAHLLFLLPKSLWQQIIENIKDGCLKQKLSSVLMAEGLFGVLQKKHFCIFRAALKVSCLKNLDIFSLKTFNINNNVEGRTHTLLHFSSYHLSVASSEQHETKTELEKVVLTLLKLGANALQLTEEGGESTSSISSSRSSRKRKVSSLSLLNMGFSNQSKGTLSSDVQEAMWASSIGELLQQQPLCSQTKYSEEKASKIAKTAARRFISFRR